MEAHDNAFLFRARALEKAVATQGHGMVLVEYPDFEKYPDFDDAALAELAATPANLTGSRDLICAEWERKGRGVIAAITKLCARDDFDCSSGFALAGYSQGSGFGGADVQGQQQVHLASLGLGVRARVGATGPHLVMFRDRGPPIPDHGVGPPLVP